MHTAFRVFCICLFTAFFGFANVANAEKVGELRMWLAFGQNPSVICNTLRIAGRLPVSMTNGHGPRGQVHACERTTLKENYLSEETARKLPVGTELVFIVKAEPEPANIVVSTQIASLEERLATAEAMLDFLFMRAVDVVGENQILTEKLAASEKENDELFQAGHDQVVDNDRLVAKVMDLEERVADAEDRPTWLIVVASAIAAFFFGTLFGFLMTGDKTPAVLSSEVPTPNTPKRKPVLSVEEIHLDPELEEQNKELKLKVKGLEDLLKLLDEENRELNSKLVEREALVNSMSTKIITEETHIAELERVVAEHADAIREHRPAGIFGTHALVDFSRTGLVPVNTPPMNLRILKVEAPCGQGRDPAELTLSQIDGDPHAHIVRCKACQEKLQAHANNSRFADANGATSRPARTNNGSASLGRGTLPHRRLDS